MTLTVRSATVTGATTKVSDLWSRENILWLAGLLEGEGSFHIKGPGKVAIQLGMTDEDVVRKAALISGCGNVNGPYIPRGNRKPMWAFKVSNGSHCYALCSAIYPFMGSRRAGQIRALMGSWFERQRCAPRHGTRAKYQSGCRCDGCTEASRAYYRGVYWGGYREIKNAKKRRYRQEQKAIAA